jgi:hypothetical protein
MPMNKVSTLLKYILTLYKKNDANFNILSLYHNFCLLFSSPEPKVQSELLESKAGWSVVMRQQSFFSLKPLDKFTSNFVCRIRVAVTP